MITKMTPLAKKIFESKAWEITEYCIFTLFLLVFFHKISHYDSSLFQIWKQKDAMIYLSAFASVLFIVRKVKLFNVPSLIATLVMILIAIYRFNYFKETADILAVDRYQVLCEWIVLMIVIDMFLYGNVNNVFLKYPRMVAFYGILAGFFIFHNHGRNDPMYFAFPMGIFMLIKIDEEKWEKLIKCLFSAAFVHFLYIIFKSFYETEEYTGRLYGNFVNIGIFGIYLCCQFVFAFVTILYSKKTCGRKSVLYVVSVIWMALVVLMIWLANTRTSLVGIMAILLTAYLFVRKDMSKKAISRRGIKAGIAVLVLAAVYVGTLYIASKGVLWGLMYPLRQIPILSPIAVRLGQWCDSINRLDTTNFGTILYSGINNISSGRLDIIKAFSPYMNFSGNENMAIETNGYMAVAVHNTYVQFIVDYGYPSAVLLFAFVIISFVIAIREYIKRGLKPFDAMIFLWIAMCLGTWVGETTSFNYPSNFIMLMLAIRLMARDKEIEQC